MKIDAFDSKYKPETSLTSSNNKQKKLLVALMVGSNYKLKCDPLFDLEFLIEMHALPMGKIENNIFTIYFRIKLRSLITSHELTYKSLLV